MDVIVLILPVPLVMKLQMNRRGKLGLLVVFVLGTLSVTPPSYKNFRSLTIPAAFASRVLNA